MAIKWFTKRWALALAGVSGLVLLAAAACGSDDATVATTGPAPTAKPAATAAPANTAVALATATSAPAAATATTAPTGPVGMAPAGKVTIATNLIDGVYGVPFLGPYRGSTPKGMGLHETLFWYQDGEYMAPLQAESWSLDPTGTKATIKIKQGIPWYSPVGFETLDLGELDAEDVVWWMNTGNSTTNPESTYPDAGDFASVMLAAKQLDKYTLELPLVAPTFVGLPLSQFGNLGAALGPISKKAYDRMGYKWLNDHEVGTGPYRFTLCVAGDRCQVKAVQDHWRATAHVDDILLQQVPDTTTRVAMLKNGQADMAFLDFKNVPGLIADASSGIRFVETMPGGFVGQSVIWSGNTWEEFHARTGAALNQSSAPPYAKDYPWIGNPWGDASTGKCDVSATCKAAPYTDTDNPAGMSDMEQARLVRLALSHATDRASLNKNILGDLGTPIYSEYTGPEYPGWDPKRGSGEWTFNTTTPIKPSAAGVGVQWEQAFDVAKANALLDQAGYKADANGVRFEMTLQNYAAETGEVTLTVGDALVSMWAKVGIKLSQLREDYGGVISPRMRLRTQFWPVMKNGDVHSNVFPLELPIPPVDSSISRPGFGVGFEAVPLAKFYFTQLAEKDKKGREAIHMSSVDWMTYWQLYTGLYQIPKGVAATSRIKGWSGPQEHYNNVSSHYEYIELK